ncbi:MAG: acyl-CoA carboxylase epsilon subunit [Propionibacteriaceae bacterium]|nr:acyl-CoA carboxylase epsilon subunit [Propionibacteriaceae bacterium]
MSEVQVVRGTPDDDELAAVVASLAALAAAAPATAPTAEASQASQAAWGRRDRLIPGAAPFGPPGWSRTCP